MKYRVFWELDDFKCGSIVCRNGINLDFDNEKHLSYALRVSYIISFQMIAGGKEDRRYSKVSLYDGMTTEKVFTKQEIIDSFNSDELGYSMLNAEQILKLMKYKIKMDNIYHSSKVLK